VSEERLGRWTFQVEAPVAWGDMDALGHVNNTVYLKWFETARIAYFEKSGILSTMTPTGVGPILAKQTIDYRLAIKYPDRVKIATSVTRLGRTSWSMGFRIFSDAHGGALAAEGEGIFVMLRYESGEKVELDDRVKQAIFDVEGA
jgi:acyl-CoA thioester hydrolase